MAANADWKSNPDAASLVDHAQRLQSSLDAAEASGDSRTAAFEWEASVASSLLDLRKSMGYSQAYVVSRLEKWGIEMHQTTLAKLEAGKRPVRLAELFALASIYRVTPGTVLFSAQTPIDGTQDIDEQIAGFEAESARLRSEFLTYAEAVFDLIRGQADSRAGYVNVLRAFGRTKRSGQSGVDQAEA